MANYKETQIKYVIKVGELYLKKLSPMAIEFSKYESEAMKFERFDYELEKTSPVEERIAEVSTKLYQQGFLDSKIVELKRVVEESEKEVLFTMIGATLKLKQEKKVEEFVQGDRVKFTENFVVPYGLTEIPFADKDDIGTVWQVIKDDDYVFVKNRFNDVVKVSKKILEKVDVTRGK